MKFSSSGSHQRSDLHAANKPRRAVKRTKKDLVVPLTKDAGIRSSTQSSTRSQPPLPRLVPMPKLRLLPRIRPRSRPVVVWDTFAADSCAFVDVSMESGDVPLLLSNLFTLGQEEDGVEESGLPPMTVTPTCRQPEGRLPSPERSSASSALPAFPNLDESRPTTEADGFATPTRRRSSAPSGGGGFSSVLPPTPCISPPPLAPQCFLLGTSLTTTTISNERILLPELLLG
jgi:hypothetical protein